MPASSYYTWVGTAGINKNTPTAYGTDAKGNIITDENGGSANLGGV